MAGNCLYCCNAVTSVWLFDVTVGIPIHLPATRNDKTDPTPSFCNGTGIWGGEGELLMPVGESLWHKTEQFWPHPVDSDGTHQITARYIGLLQSCQPFLGGSQRDLVMGRWMLMLPCGAQTAEPCCDGEWNSEQVVWRCVPRLSHCPWRLQELDLRKHCLISSSDSLNLEAIEL